MNRYLHFSKSLKARDSVAMWEEDHGEHSGKWGMFHLLFCTFSAMIETGVKAGCFDHIITGVIPIWIKEKQNYVGTR